jgi:TolB protein
MTILAMVGMPLHAQQAKPYRIVFWVEDDIFTINADGSGLLHLEYNPGFGSVAWSPDGSLMAVTSNTTGNFQIYTMNPDGSNLQSLTQEADGVLLFAYSPDGQWIAYWHERDIWIMHPDGSGARQMTFDDEDNRLADWSPDSAEMLIFRFGEQHQLIVVDVETGDTRALPAPPGDVRSPQWIP